MRLRRQAVLANFLRPLPFVFVIVSAGPVIAADAGKDVHLGVASCAGNTCHGSTRPFADSHILQSEYFIWQRKDAHARAYQTLLSSRSDAIAAKLGLGPAKDAQACLVCHAENAPADRRGPRYQIGDGIGCEACHGPAEHWIGSHEAGYANNEARLAAGLYPTWDADARGQLCAGCHVGDDAHPMSHAIMAAGHPPILFEMNTYQTLMPPHWKSDDAYAARKGAQDPARDWIAGQVAASRVLLDNLAGPRLMHGAFPELAFFDCDACHHSMKAGRARSDRSGGMPAGNVPAADAPLVLVGRWLDATDAQTAAAWWKQWHALQEANTRGPAALQEQAKAMRAQLDAAVAAKAQIPISSAPLRRLLGLIVADARRAHQGDYAYSQQTAMAVSVLFTALSQRGDAAVTPQLRAAVDALYLQVHDRDRFSVTAYAASLDRLASLLGG